MKVEGFIIKEESYKDNKFYSLYIVIDKQEYLLGTIKGIEKNIKYINCVHKEYKKD